MSLCPNVKVLNNGFIIDSHIKDTETFSISHTVPGFCEIKLYHIVTRSCWEMIAQFMTTKTIGTENRGKRIINRL